MDVYKSISSLLTGTKLICLTMHSPCLYWLMSTGLPFQSTFCWPCKFTNSDVVPMVSLNQHWGPNITLTVSTCLSRPCSGILTYCGYMLMS